MVSEPHQRALGVAEGRLPAGCSPIALAFWYPGRREREAPAEPLSLRKHWTGHPSPCENSRPLSPRGPAFHGSAGASPWDGETM
ncbi:MAG: hypothetical protein RLZZ436_3618 [Planctomycetota bacterium]|jgi:hypothetical protein